MIKLHSSAYSLKKAVKGGSSIGTDGDSREIVLARLYSDRAFFTSNFYIYLAFD